MATKKKEKKTWKRTLRDALEELQEYLGDREAHGEVPEDTRYYRFQVKEVCDEVLRGKDPFGRPREDFIESYGPTYIADEIVRIWNRGMWEGDVFELKALGKYLGVEFELRRKGAD